MKLENYDNDKNYMLIVMDLNDGSWKYSIHYLATIPNTNK